MAIVKNNILLQCVDGSIGEEITIYERNGQIIMAKKRGPSTHPPSDKQLTARMKMKIASAIAKEWLKDPQVKAYYAAKAGPGQNAFNMAVKAAYALEIVKDLPPVKATKKNTPPKTDRVAIPDVNPLFLFENLLHHPTQFRNPG